MQVSVLGPVEIHRDGDITTVGPRLQRLLAALTARFGEVVSADQLAEVVWDGSPPEGAEGTLRSYVSRLRMALGTDSDTIVFRQSGYALVLPDEAVDAVLFERELDEAEHALRVGEIDRSGALVESALERWRGAPLDGLDDPMLQPIRVRLEERRVEALELHAEILLATDRGEAAIALARSLVEERPLRERPREILMRGLYLAGRKAEAIRLYEEYRQVLGDQTGLDPSSELAELETQMVRGELQRRSSHGRARGYTLHERLGSGAFSVVYRAVQPGLDREVAVKIVRSELADQPDFIRRFEQEARLVAAVEHPNIVPLYDFWREPGAAYLAMRLMRGGNVRELISARGAMGGDQMLAMLRQVGGALHAAHRAGIVHRDVRPANLLLDDDGTTYLSDFGIAATAIDPGRLPVEYAAPEMLKGEAVDVSADVLSLGITIFELLTGRLPFAESTDRSDLIRRQLEEPLPPVTATRPDLPTRIDSVIAKATSKSVETRHGSVQELVADVTIALGWWDRRSSVQHSSFEATRNPNPYVGLSPFRESDSEGFHGRERLVAEIIEALDRHRLVTVVGPSGSGKSSVVRAGVIPAVRRGALQGSADWFTAYMTPGADPIDSLETAIRRIAAHPPTSLREELRQPGGIRRSIARVLPDERSTLFLVIDQWEELSTLDVRPEVRARFLDELAEAILAPTSQLRVLTTLRADHYAMPLSAASIAEAFVSGVVTIQPMRADELERAIVAPAHASGVEVDGALVAELVAEVSARPAALPQMQFALTELYERRDGDVMTARQFAALGGLSGALVERAERTITRHGADVDQRVRSVFSRLVAPGASTDADRRRRASLGEFGDDPETLRMLDGLVAARLLTTGHDQRTRAPTIEIAHEALIRDWPRLRDWVDEDRDDLRVLAALRRRATEWESSGRDPSGLAIGTQLTTMTELVSRRPEMVRPDEVGWVTASADAERDRRRREQEDAARDRRQNRLLRVAATSLAVVALIATVATVVALGLRSEAVDAGHAADARSFQMAASAAIDDDPEAAMLLALAAVDGFARAGREPPSDALDVLRNAASANTVAQRFDGGSYIDVSDDGERYLTAGVHDDVMVEIDAGDHREQVRHDLDVAFIRAGWFAGDDVHAVVNDGGDMWIEHGRITEWEPLVADAVVATGIHDTGVFSMVTSNQRWLAAIERGEVTVWDHTVPNSSPVRFEGRDGSGIVLIGTALVYAPTEGGVLSVDLTTGATTSQIAADEVERVGTIDISADGTALALVDQATDDVHVYDVATGEHRWSVPGIPKGAAPVWGAAGRVLFVWTPFEAFAIDAVSGSTLWEGLPPVAELDSVTPLPGVGRFALAGFDRASGVVVVEHSHHPSHVAQVTVDVGIGPVRWMEVTDDERFLVAATESNVAIVELDDESVTTIRRGLPIGVTNEIRDVNTATVPVISANGEFYAVADRQGYSTLYSTRGGEARYVAPPGWDVRAVGNHGHVVAIHRDVVDDEPARTLVVWLDSGEEIEVGYPSQVFRGQFSPDDRWLGVVGLEGLTRLYDTTTGDLLTDLHDGDFYASGHLDFSTDGSTLVVGRWDGDAVVFDFEALEAGEKPLAARRGEFPMQGGFANPIAVSGDGRVVVSTGPVVDAYAFRSDGTSLATIPIAAENGGVTVSADGSRLYVADGPIVSVHELDGRHLIEMSRRRAQRSLTPDECRRVIDRPCG